MARASLNAVSSPVGASAGAFMCGACLCVTGLDCMSELAHMQMETLFALQVSLSQTSPKRWEQCSSFAPAQHPGLEFSPSLLSPLC